TENCTIRNPPLSQPAMKARLSSGKKAKFRSRGKSARTRTVACMGSRDFTLARGPWGTRDSFRGRPAPGRLPPWRSGNRSACWAGSVFGVLVPAGIDLIRLEISRDYNHTKVGRQPE